MPAKLVKGDIFSTPGINAVAHGCNCVGVMGAGIAAQVSKRYPALYREYARRCSEGKFNLGDVYTWEGANITVFNLGTQFQPGPNAVLSAVKHTVNKVCGLASALDLKQVAMPLIGSGIGGLNPKQVQDALLEIGQSRNVTLLIFKEYIRSKPAVEVTP